MNNSNLLGCVRSHNQVNFYHLFLNLINIYYSNLRTIEFLMTQIPCQVLLKLSVRVRGWPQLSGLPLKVAGSNLIVSVYWGQSM